MIVVNAFYVVKEEQEAVFLSEMNKLVAASRNEEGNISYNLYQQTDAPLRYVMVESWRDEQSIAKHAQTEHFQLYVEKSAAFFAEPKQVHRYEA